MLNLISAVPAISELEEVAMLPEVVWPCLLVNVNVASDGLSR
jgi:hypothetical protein